MYAVAGSRNLPPSERGSEAPGRAFRAALPAERQGWSGGGGRRGQLGDGARGRLLARGAGHGRGHVKPGTGTWAGREGGLRAERVPLPGGCSVTGGLP